MVSKDTAIAIRCSRTLAGWASHGLWQIGLLLGFALGFPGEARTQVLQVPSRTSPSSESPPGRVFQPMPAPASDKPGGSTFQAELERSQIGPAPVLGPGFSAVPSDACPECGQGGPNMGPNMGPYMGPHMGPNPARPGERLEGFFRRWLDPPVRYRGPGQPLLRESWLYRPYSFGWFMGPMYGGELVDDWVTQKGGYLGGFRLGWDFHHYWGCEIRLAAGYARIEDSDRAKAAQEAADDARGLAPDDPFRHRFDESRDSDLGIVGDFSFLYYPWGDSVWRPYFLLGMGAARIGFEDRLSQYWKSSALTLPLGVGLKLRWNDWLVFRMELIDTLLIPGKDINAVNEFSFNAGVEIHFGGPRKAYWPWNPGLHYW